MKSAEQVLKEWASDEIHFDFGGTEKIGPFTKEAFKKISNFIIGRECGHFYPDAGMKAESISLDDDWVEVEQIIDRKMEWKIKMKENEVEKLNKDYGSGVFEVRNLVRFESLADVLTWVTREERFWHESAFRQAWAGKTITRL